MHLDDAPFHAGERDLQARLGLAQRLDAVGRTVIRDYMPDPHRELFEQLPTLLVAAQDDQGQPWATMLAGAPGFVRSPDERTLRVGTRPMAPDPVTPLLRVGSPLGLLGLQPHTRRRNRMNGWVTALDRGSFTVQVAQSFGNCPQYIQARTPTWQPTRRRSAPQAMGTRLDHAARALIARSDTLFIASASGPRVGPGRAEGVDVSHRGGLPGFVRLVDDATGTRLVMPDQAGNAMFNTLGNLQLWPHAGLLFIDPSNGDMLHLAVHTHLQFEGPALAAWPGAQRLLHGRVVGGWWRPGASPLSWSAPEFAAQFAAARQKPERD
ncbi:MAG: pyridoxamine 5'-phosphate oxidase family protein [Burkholderiales bacterium]|nr:pyridoxamine 5'-phosphate oxidase family protein [Burkholderiales bacterium]